jgi:FHS family L-fucose permease-like MFS transporter
MNRKNILPFALVTSLFFLWALTSNLIPTLIPHLKKACRLTDLQSAYIDSAYWMAYFVVAIPAGLVMQRYGYKKAIIIGLFIAAIGTFLFYPAASVRTFGFFLFALFVVASGMTFLETAANPYMTVLGPEKTAPQRLNFAQAFNGLGAFIAAFFLSKVILSGKEITDEALAKMRPEQADLLLTQEAKSVQMPYLVIGIVLVLVAVVFLLTTFPPEKKEENKTNTAGEKLNLFQHKQLLLGVIAQFFYVGAQVCVSSFFIRYCGYAAGMQELEAANYLGFLLLGFMVGRYAGTLLMRYIQPAVLLGLYAVINIVLLVLIAFVGGKASVYALIGVEFFMSIMYPTIFSLAIKGLGAKTKMASSYLVMAIVGGAILPVLMGKVSDVGNIQLAYLVPALCFLVVFYFSIKVKTDHETAKPILSVAL